MLPIIAAALAACIAAVIAYKMMFTDLADFADCVGYWLTPDILSAFRGEWLEDASAQMRFMVFLGLVTAAGFGGYRLASRSPAIASQASMATRPQP
jgi:hypothetical protein